LAGAFAEGPAGAMGSVCNCKLCSESLIQPVGARDAPTAAASSAVEAKADGEIPYITEEEDRWRMEVVQKRGKRQSITGESVKPQDAKEYVKPVYRKDPDGVAALREVLKTSGQVEVLFGHLAPAVLEDVINAFQETTSVQGTDLIRQGDQGDCLYIIRDGEVDVFVNRPGPDGSVAPGKGTRVVSLGNGKLFGELALMYMAPRAATVTVKSPSCRLWTLDREPFRMLLVQASQKKMEQYEGWLHEIDILKALNQYELSKISECLESDCYDAGENIITQGQAGEKFFILEEGTCAAFINGPEGEKQVKTYTQKGDYFGELALLRNEPRNATVRATGDGAEVLSMSKEDFTNLMGPIQDILAKHADRYPAYAQLLQ